MRTTLMMMCGASLPVKIAHMLAKLSGKDRREMKCRTRLGSYPRRKPCRATACQMPATLSQ